MDAVGPRAARAYATSLARLREHPKATTKLLLEGYDKVAPRRHMLRWKILFTLGEIGHPSAVPLLVSVANEPARPELEPGSGSSKPPISVFSATPKPKKVGKQQHLNQLAATNALSKIAATGNKIAVDGLRSLLHSKHRHVIAAAAIELYRMKRFSAADRKRLGPITRIADKQLVRPRPAGSPKPKTKTKKPDGDKPPVPAPAGQGA